MNLEFAFRYLKYYFTAGTKHDVHSPFFYKLVTTVIHPDSRLNDFHVIERLRRKLLNSSQPIIMEDFGAGHNGVLVEEKTLKLISRNSSKSQKYCRLLFRLIQFFQSDVIIELGTAVGMSAMYIAAGNPSGRLFTLEGNSALARIAENNFKEAGLENITLVTGRFEEQLPQLLDQLPKVDFIYIDGHHRLTPTLAYFEMCLEKSHKNTIFVLDDINWSDEMREVWKSIKNHPKVTVTIDLFMMGLVFLNPDFSKEDFVIRF